MTSKIVLASGNKGKLREMQAILADHNIELVPQSHFDIGEAVEDGLSFVENAIIKARYAAERTGLPALSDDSGIEVDALKGEPGIYSARYAEDWSDEAGVDIDEKNNRKLLASLEGVKDEDRTARFQCAIVYMRHGKDPMPLIFQASWEGRILHQAGGVNGFGYDPLFFVPSHDCASAELDPAIKNAISHRGQALRKLGAHWADSTDFSQG